MLGFSGPGCHNWLPLPLWQRLFAKVQLLCLVLSWMHPRIPDQLGAQVLVLCPHLMSIVPHLSDPDECGSKAKLTQAADQHLA